MTSLAIYSDWFVHLPTNKKVRGRTALVAFSDLWSVAAGEPVSGCDPNQARCSAVDLADITAALGGEDEAYRRLVERYQQLIARQMRRFSRDPSICEELTHDVFVEAWRSLPSYRSTSPWLHWLRRIAVRVGYRYWEKTEQSSAQVLLTDLDWAGVRERGEEFFANDEVADLVHAVLAQLRPTDRLVLTLVYLDGCSMADAAKRTGWSLTATKVRAFRARNRLRKLIEKEPS